MLLVKRLAFSNATGYCLNIPFNILIYRFPNQVSETSQKEERKYQFFTTVKGRLIVQALHLPYAYAIPVIPKNIILI